MLGAAGAYVVLSAGCCNMKRSAAASGFSERHQHASKQTWSPGSTPASAACRMRTKATLAPLPLCRDGGRRGQAPEASPTAPGRAGDQQHGGHVARQESSHSHPHEAPLGRSPSRGHHIPANFLLNFRRDQYNEQACSLNLPAACVTVG